MNRVTVTSKHRGNVRLCLDVDGYPSCGREPCGALVVELLLHVTCPECLSIGVRRPGEERAQA